MAEYLILFAVVLAVNLLPAFGPPTWSILVLYGLNSDMPVGPAIFVAALAAASGRFLLAHTFRRLGTKVPERWRRNLVAARQAFESKRQARFAALGLFALSPLPSAQLFEAAGLTGVRLAPFTAAFFAGRLVSYSIYALGARALRTETLGDAFRDSFSSPLGIAVQVAMIGALVALVRIDWTRVGAGGRRDPEAGAALRKSTNENAGAADLDSAQKENKSHG